MVQISQEQLTNFENTIVNYKTLGKKRNIKLEFNYFMNDDIKNIIIGQLGNEGALMFQEKTSAICFKVAPNLRFILKTNKTFNVTDFYNKGFVFEIIGSTDNNPNSFMKSILKDMRSNWIKVLVSFFAYTILLNPTNLLFESLTKLNDVLVNIIGFFIGTFFVFVGFFYGDKEKSINLYLKGLFRTYFETDKYILNLAILTLICSVISNSIILMKQSLIAVNTFSFIKWFFNIIGWEQYSYLLNFNYMYLKYSLAYLITYISIIFTIICFDAIGNYYFSLIQNKYFADAFDAYINKEWNND